MVNQSRTRYAVEPLSRTEMREYQLYYKNVFNGANNLDRKTFRRFHELILRMYKCYLNDSIPGNAFEYYNNVKLPAEAIIRQRFPDILTAHEQLPPPPEQNPNKTTVTAEESRDFITANKIAIGGNLTAEEQTRIVESWKNSEIGRIIQWISDLITEMRTFIGLMGELLESLPEYMRLVNAVMQLLVDNKDGISAGMKIVQEYSDAMKDGKAAMTKMRTYLKENHMLSGDPYMPWPAPNFTDQEFCDLYSRVQMAKGLPIVGGQIQAMLSSMRAMNYQAQNGIGYINIIDALSDAPALSSGFVPGAAGALVGDLAGAAAVPAWFISKTEAFRVELGAVEKSLHRSHQDSIQKLIKPKS